MADVFRSAGKAVVAVLLFGSRARNAASPESDYDFLVVLKDQIPFVEKRKLAGEVQKRLAKAGIRNDLVIQSELEFAALKALPGNVSHAASIEGIAL